MDCHLFAPCDPGGDASNLEATWRIKQIQRTQWIEELQVGDRNERPERGVGKPEAVFPRV